MSERSYQSTLGELNRALASGIHPSLDGITELCDRLGNPQDSFVSIQVAGTNGKTSTARITESIVRAHGLRTALYTSPELERPPERMEVGGAVVSDGRFADCVSRALEAAEELRPGTLGTSEGFTEFELVTAAALWLFAEQRVDCAVLEVGLGGRWDATSIVSPAVAIVTGIGLDHMHILGDTLEAIAAEKAAIIKPASAPVLGPGTAGVEHVFLERSIAAGTHARAVIEVGAPTPVSEALTVRFGVTERPRHPGGMTVLNCRGVHSTYDALAMAAPAYQAANVAVSVAGAEALLGRALDVHATREALLQVRLPGRFELLRVQPPLIIDGSHNPQAAAVLAGAVSEAFGASRPALLLGVLSDKDAYGIVEQLTPVCGEVFVTQPDSERALPAEALADVVHKVTGIHPRLFSDVGSALHALADSSCAGLLATGSLRIAGEVRSRFRNNEERASG